MKHTAQILLSSSLCTFLCIFTADSDERIPLLTIATEDDTSAASTTTRQQSVKDVIGHLTATNNTLNASRIKLTTLHDLPNYYQLLQLDTVTKIDVSHNTLDNEALFTLIRSMQHVIFIDASDNLIDNIDAIPPHARLKTLLMHNNCITQLDVQKVFSRFSQLKQVSLHNNCLTPQSVTHVGGTYPTVEELFFDNGALNEKLVKKLIVAFPNLQAEINSNSNAIQMHYSHLEPLYDCGRSSCKNDDTVIGWYGLPAFLGLCVGAASAVIVTGMTDPNRNLPKNDPRKEESFHKLMRDYCAILIPTCTILAPIVTRAIARLCGYFCTDEEDRYELVYDREISKRPTLLQLVKTDTKNFDAPGQEHNERQSSAGQED